ncbi:S1 family peptidase [Candidatus Electronema sp. TJ]|uniref:S1 family peptidase n=1 Tax=Candidatus Electronema sp. TJ TaxID=3401573 RepID=UPI003AA9DB63
MSNTLEKYLIRIENSSGEIKGAGFLVSAMEAVTCAHVISDSFNVKRETCFEAPQGVLHITFPFIHKEVRLQAYVVGWDHANDIAILRLKSVPPAAAEPACFSGEKIYALRNHPVRTYGFPNGYNDGAWSNDWKIKDRTADNQVQLESDISTGKPIEGGFSGAPVFDEQLNQVVGMIAATDRNINRKVAFMIPAEAIARVWPILLEKVNRKPSRSEREICEEYLKESFHEDNKYELISICRNNFPEVGRTISDQHSIDRIIYLFLGYCERRTGFSAFWIAMKTVASSRYEKLYSEWEEKCK